MQILANVLGVPVTRYAGSEIGPAFGAARLAMLALKAGSLAEICRKPEVRDVIEPDRERHAAYAARPDAYRRLYAALRGEFRLMQGEAVGERR